MTSRALHQSHSNTLVPICKFSLADVLSSGEVRCCIISLPIVGV